MATTADFRNGMTISMDGVLWTIMFFQHHKPGKGNTVVRTKLRNVLTGSVLEKTFRAGERIDESTERAGERIEEGANKAGERIEEGAERLEREAEDLKRKVD